MDAILQSVFGNTVNLVSLPAAGTGSVKGAGLTAKTIYEINCLADGLIIGPGNLFENGGLDVDLTALAALRVPTMLFSVSAGRIFDNAGKLTPRTDSMSPDKVAAICRSASLILVRDKASQEHLAAIDCNNALIAGCPALFLGGASLPFPYLESELAHSILISVRHPKLMSVPYQVQGRIHSDLRRLLDRLKKQKADVRLLCHDYQDLAFARMFPDVPMLYTEDPYRFLSWLRSCRLNITFRLHAFVCCLAMETHSIPFTYDERTMSLIETLGMSEWGINVFESEDLVAEVQERSASLERLDKLTRLARPIWDQLYRLMTETAGEFASGINGSTAGQLVPLASAAGI